MNIPKYIKEAINKNAKHAALAGKNNNIIKEWLIANNLNNDTILDQLIDAVELTNNPNSFINFLESESKNWIGNDDKY